jgi:hypothetical protein
MRKKRKELAVVGDDKIIVVKGQDGKADTIIHVEPEKCGIPKVVVRSHFKKYKAGKPYFTQNTYFERLFDEYESQIEENDKLIVAEAFRKNRVTITYHKYKFWDSVRMFFGKEPKREPEVRRMYLGRN